MKFSVYKVTNLDTGKEYYGQTGQSIRNRMYGHKYRGTGGYQDSDNLKTEIIAICKTRKEAQELECYLITKLSPEYNLYFTDRLEMPGNKLAGKYNKILKGQSVICIEDSIEFASLREAAQHYGIADTSIQRSIKNKTGFIKKLNKTFKFISWKENYYEFRPY